MCIAEAGEVGEGDAPAAFDDGLRVAAECEEAVGAVPDSELLGGADYCGGVAVADEDTGLAGSHEDCAVLALVDVYAGGGVEEQDAALLTVRYLELLHL